MEFSRDEFNRQVEQATAQEPVLRSTWETLQNRSELEIAAVHLPRLSADSVVRALGLVRAAEEFRLPPDQGGQPFIPAYQIIRSYIDLMFSEDDTVKALDIDTRRLDLGEELAGMVYCNRYSHYVVVVNASLDEHLQDLLVFQEMKRIAEQRPRQLRLIGNDFVNHLEAGLDEYMEAIFSLFL
ncbi:MAG: hypothetical protein QHH02_02745 [Syntrophomonadaceae bacterium]|nr:hypothetical protein [Syntrophomonadaceae bacterium]